jgi:hypothetical protein
MSYQPISFQKTNSVITEYTVLGERHSGTNWLQRLVASRLNIPLTWRFGSKHFIDSLNPNLMAAANSTLFICITRNIYDWIGGFFKLPHHVDRSIALNIDKFLLKEWKNECFDNHFFHKTPYKNIFDLRANKLLFYFSFLPNIVDNVLIIRYEDLMINPEIIVSFISENFNIPKTSKKYSSLTIPRKKSHYRFNNRILQIIDNNTDWSIEYYYKYYISFRS